MDWGSAIREYFPLYSLNVLPSPSDLGCTPFTMRTRSTAISLTVEPQSQKNWDAAVGLSEPQTSNTNNNKQGLFISSFKWRWPYTFKKILMAGTTIMVRDYSI